MTDQDNNIANNGTALSIQDIERVVSAIVRQQGQAQRDQMLSVVTDVDKEKTQFLIAMNELKDSLLDKVKDGQRDAKNDYLQVIQSLENNFKEDIQELKKALKEAREQQTRRDDNCKKDHDKQLERIIQNNKDFEIKALAEIDKQKPKYFAIISVILVLLTPVGSWLFDMHSDVVATKAAISALREQEKSILKQQEQNIKNIDSLRFDSKALMKDMPIPNAPVKGN